MLNLFYVPPHHSQDIHPKPVGVRTVVKRNQPTRLDLSAHHPALAVDAGLVTLGDIAAEDHLGPQIVPRRRRSIRSRIGGMLIRMGHKIAGDSPLPEGQPV